MKMRRGDLVSVVFPGDYGKPRPALIVQSDAFGELASVTVLPLTSDLRSAPLLRIAVGPSPENGLELPSQIMIDKPTTVPLRKVCSQIGRLEDDATRSADVALGRFLGLT